ncbi:MAG: FAD binding domain-containing protein [Gaiellaceae bacterium]
MPSAVQWLEPETLGEALALRAEHPDATPVAGGTFIGILINQELLYPTAFLSLRRVRELDSIECDHDSLLLGAMTRHRAVEQSATIRERWPVLAEAFALVASPRVRHQATVGGVVADADYASDPPAVLSALDAEVIVRSVRGTRSVPIDELITGYYETSLEPDELVVNVRVPRLDGPAVYRKFRSRSEEDRPCVSVAAVRRGERLKVVVGAVASRLQHFPEVCASADGDTTSSATASAVAEAYAERIDPLGDGRGSSEYRRRIIAVEVRRAIEQLDASRS